MVFLADFHICHRHRWRWGFISGAKSFKVNFLDSKSGSVISLKFSKAACVQILVLVFWFYPEVFFVFSVFAPNYRFLKQFHFIANLALVLCGPHSLNGVSFMVVFRFIELFINKEHFWQVYSGWRALLSMLILM